MEKVICYYHKVDLDGKCSAAIVKRKYPDAECIGVNYPDKPDFEAINTGDMVFIVDFSFEPEDMVTLSNITQDNVVWIDHHRSAMLKTIAYDLKTGLNLTADIDGLRLSGQAGCELTWEYLFPDEPMPEAVRLLGRYDVWDKKNLGWWEKFILPFQYGMRINNWEPDLEGWRFILDENEDGVAQRMVESRIKNGKVLLKYEDQQNKVYANASAFPVEFEGYKAWAINKYIGNSKIFEDLRDANERPLWILFGCKNGTWKYSLYSVPGSGIDVSKIAVRYDGGGHAGAAGFKSDKYLL